MLPCLPGAYQFYTSATGILAYDCLLLVLQSMGMDIVRPFTLPSSRGHRFILAITDFLKMGRNGIYEGVQNNGNNQIY